MEHTNQRQTGRHPCRVGGTAGFRGRRLGQRGHLHDGTPCRTCEGNRRSGAGLPTLRDRSDPPCARREPRPDPGRTDRSDRRDVGWILPGGGGQPLCMEPRSPHCRGDHDRHAREPLRGLALYEANGVVSVGRHGFSPDRHQCGGRTGSWDPDRPVGVPVERHRRGRPRDVRAGELHPLTIDRSGRPTSAGAGRGRPRRGGPPRRVLVLPVRGRAVLPGVRTRSVEPTADRLRRSGVRRRPVEQPRGPRTGLDGARPAGRFRRVGSGDRQRRARGQARLRSAR